MPLYRIVTDKVGRFAEGNYWDIIEMDLIAAEVPLRDGDIEYISEVEKPEEEEPVPVKLDKEEQRGKAFNNLMIIDSILKKLKLEYTLDGGTLLGAVRENDFCEDDHDDIDLTIMDNVEDKLLKLIELASMEGFALKKYWGIRPKKTSQLVFLKDGMHVDIMFKKVKGKSIWWTIYGGKRKVTYKKCPSNLVVDKSGKLKLGMEVLRGMEFPVLKQAKKYLEYRYGDWETKVHRDDYSCYETDKAIVKNYAKI